MFVLNAYFCRELRFVAILRSKLRFLLRNTGVDSDFYSEIQGLTQILLRISEEKIGGWGLWATSSTRTVQNKCSRAIDQERLDISTQTIFWPGPRLSLVGKNQDQQSTVTSSSLVVGVSDSAMDTSS